MRRSVLPIAGSLFCLLMLVQPARTQTFTRVFTAADMPDIWTQAILQDRFGFLWFGTDDGLLRYNGYSFTRYREGFPGVVITALAESAAGDLWVGTHEGLVRFDPNDGSTIIYQHSSDDPQSLVNNDIQHLRIDDAGSLWIATGGGLQVMDTAGNLILITLREQPVRIYITFEDHDGIVWVGTQQGLRRVDITSSQLADAPFTVDGPIYAIVQDHQGDLWIGTGSGLLRWHQGSGELQHYRRQEIGYNDSLSSNVIRVLHTDRAGDMWVGTDSGLNRYNPVTDGFITFKRDAGRLDSLGGDAIRAVYEDRTGLLWVGTADGGVSMFNPASEVFRAHRHQPGSFNSLPSSVVFAITQDRTGALWIGTLGGLAVYEPRYSSYMIYQYDPTRPYTLRSNEIRALLYDRRGQIWIGTASSGLHQFDRQTGLFYPILHTPNQSSGISSNQITVLFEDRTGQVWVGTRDRGLNRYQPESETFERLTGEAQAGSSHITALAQGADEQLWVGTAGGLFQVNASGNQLVAALPAYSGTVHALYAAANGTLWIGGSDGLTHYDPIQQTTMPMTTGDGSSHGSVYGILPDDEGSLWISTNRGLTHLDPASGATRNFTAADGLPGDTFIAGAAYRGRDGTLYFGSTSGLLSFDPARVVGNPHPPPIVITRFERFNEPVLTNITSPVQIALDHADRFFSLEFAALDYTAPAKNRYRYRLDGVDQNWVEAGTRRVASYANLGGGTYVFHVQGSNSDGVWNRQGLAITIHVSPPFWATIWFRSLLILLAVGSLSGGYWLRVRVLERQKHTLAAQVAERTAEIEQRRRVAEGLQDILALLNSSQPLEDILNQIVCQAKRLLEPSAVALHRLSDDVLRIQAAHGLEETYRTQIAIPSGQGITGRAAAQRQPIAVTDIRTFVAELDEPLVRDQLALVQSLMERYNAILAVPLFVNQTLYGAITLYYGQKQHFATEEIALATLFSQQAALAIENARLRVEVAQAATMAERNRLARELHDSVTQTLFSASMVADVLPRQWASNPEAARAQLTDLQLMTRSALAEMRTLLVELRPATLTQLPVQESLSHLITTAQGRTGAEVQFTVTLPDDLPDEIKVAVYRIAQEALNNIVKHAQAEHITLTLGEEQTILCLCIEDDGCGFEPAQISPGHLGLGIMAERAQAIGAHLHISSQPGRGTSIILRWKKPFMEKSDEQKD